MRPIVRRVPSLVAFCLLVSPLAAGDARMPVPDPAKQTAAEKLVKDLYQVDYAKAAAADKIALAQKLFQQATETGDDPAARFVLLREARDLAAQNGDADGAFAAVDQMAKDFVIDGGEQKLEVLAKLEALAKTTEQAAKLTEALLQATDGAVGADDYGGADKLISRAEALAARAQDMPLLTKAKARKTEIQDLAQQAKALDAARQTLAEKPDDPDANLELGRFTCFVKGDWKNGLGYLAKSNDAAMKPLAEKELTAPRQAAEQVVLGDAWWDYAGKETGAIKSRAQARAAKWYREAQPRLVGLMKIKVEKRLESLGPEASQGTGPIAGKAEKGDGKIHIQSKPAGAQILVMQNGELRDTGMKTPSLLQLPVGRTEVVLRLAKFDEVRLSADVTNAISRLVPVVMQPERFDVTVTVVADIGDGWGVFVDGKPVMDKSGKPAVAPCTIRLPAGNATIAVAKEGFRDPYPVRLTIKADGSNGVEVKGRAEKGQSAVLVKAAQIKAAEEAANPILKFVGVWIKTDSGSEFTVFANGEWKQTLDRVGAPNAKSGACAATADSIALFEGIRFTMKDGDTLSGRNPNGGAEWILRRKK